MVEHRPGILFHVTLRDVVPSSALREEAVRGVDVWCGGPLHPERTGSGFTFQETTADSSTTEQPKSPYRGWGARFQFKLKVEGLSRLPGPFRRYLKITPRPERVVRARTAPSRPSVEGRVRRRPGSETGAPPPRRPPGPAEAFSSGPVRC